MEGRMVRTGLRMTWGSYQENHLKIKQWRTSGNGPDEETFCLPKQISGRVDWWLVAGKKRQFNISTAAIQKAQEEGRRPNGGIT